ncbi:MAG TPA: DUF2934 domain-containing protein, partial [Balneolaceae bacterium]|nr:DUF2934 domain-containing protein [Balneolaceae bacterium]
PLGWGWAGFVWGYALLWFLINDRLKLLAYRILNPDEKPLLGRVSDDMKPTIEKRAYELYEQGGRREGHAQQDWDQAEKKYDA